MKRKKLVKKLSNKKKLSSDNLLNLYEKLSPSQRYDVNSYFEDDLEDVIRERVEEDFDFNDVTVGDLDWGVAERLYEELHEEYGEAEIEAEIEAANLYDQDKLQLLKKAFDIYNLDQLIEKLGITQMEAM